MLSIRYAAVHEHFLRKCTWRKYYHLPRDKSPVMDTIRPLMTNGHQNTFALKFNA